MKLFTAQQIQQIDQYTIENEPISSIDLMERAAVAWVEEFSRQTIAPEVNTLILCGPGNNGGDGLAIARILSQKHHSISVLRVLCDKNESLDHIENLSRLKKNGKVEILDYFELSNEQIFDLVNRSSIIIDAIFGSGLNRPVDVQTANFFEQINELNKLVYAVDIPSGMLADAPSFGTAIKCDHCITFEFPKLAFLLPQSNLFIKYWSLVDIQLHQAIKDKLVSPYFYTKENDARPILKQKNKFSHKGINGRGLLVAGSFGKMGAAILSGRATLKSGCGLLDIHIPAIGYDLMQRSLPEAMVSTSQASFYINDTPADLTKYTAIGIGPGLGQNKLTIETIDQLLKNLTIPSIWDADALNILSQNKEWINRLPKETILTPHPGEFKRLVGPWTDDFHKLELLQSLAQDHQIIIVLKGAHTCIALPNGSLHFNSTGNSGMATAGSGDVLSGIILGLLCQGYLPKEAAILGVYLHGLAGDSALKKESHESLIASDIIDNLGQAFKVTRQ